MILTVFRSRLNDAHHVDYDRHVRITSALAQVLSSFVNGGAANTEPGNYRVLGRTWFTESPLKSELAPLVRPSAAPGFRAATPLVAASRAAPGPRCVAGAAGAGVGVAAGGRCCAAAPGCWPPWGPAERSRPPPAAPRTAASRGSSGR